MTKIAIVDDDPMISDIYQKKFSDQGFEVYLASSGEQILEMAKKQKIDVILLDLLIPKMDGFEVIKNLRNGSYDSEIKIIVSSNLSDDENQKKAIKLGADGFVIKAQFTPSQLVDEIKKIIG
ncbi:MAG: response regulator transcription factor [Candidatus Moraniibacteriota bacterium]